MFEMRSVLTPHFCFASCRSIAGSVATWRPLRNCGVVPTAARPRPLHHHGHCRALRDSPWICAMVSQWSATVFVDSCYRRRLFVSFCLYIFSWRSCKYSFLNLINHPGKLPTLVDAQMYKARIEPSSILLISFAYTIENVGRIGSTSEIFWKQVCFF